MTTISARRLRLADFLVELRATKASLTVLRGARGRARGVVGDGVGGRGDEAPVASAGVSDCFIAMARRSTRTVVPSAISSQAVLSSRCLTVP